MSSSAPIISNRPTFVAETSATFRLALPLIAGQLGQMLIGLADTIMIGRLGVIELGAATFANTLLIVPFVLGIGLLTSVSVRVSQALGAKRPDEAGDVLRHGTWMALAFGIVTFLLALGLIPFIDWMGQPTEVAGITPPYLIICAASLIPAFLSMTWKNHADALNRPWVPFWILMGGVVLNIFLNWMLIWGKFGFPAMGLEGAGIATLISRILVALGVFFWLTRSSIVRIWTPKRWWGRCQKSAFYNLLTIGFPASFQMLTEVGAFAVCSLLIGTLGAIPLAAHQVAITCAATTFMIPLGVAMAITVRVGEAVGAGQEGRLHQILLGGWVYSVSACTLSMLTFLLFGKWIAHQFVADQAVIDIAARLLIIAGLFQLFDGVQVTAGFALRGMNDVRVPALYSVISYWVVAVPLGAALGLGLGWGADGLWAGLAAGLAVAAVMFGVRAWRLLGAARIRD